MNLKISIRILFAIVSIIYILYGLKYPFWTEEKPGMGFFPRFAGLGFLVVSIIGLKDFLRIREKNQIGSGLRISKDAWKMIFILAGYIALINVLGFLISTTILAFLVSLLAGCRKKMNAVFLAAIISLSFYLIFEKLFLILLPKGRILPYF